MNPSDALTQLLEEKVEFLLLQFTDILGSITTSVLSGSLEKRVRNRRAWGI